MMHWLIIIFQYLSRWFDQCTDRIAARFEPLLHRAAVEKKQAKSVCNLQRSEQFTPQNRTLPTALCEDPYIVQNQIRSIPHVFDRSDHNQRVIEPDMDRRST